MDRSDILLHKKTGCYTHPVFLYVICKTSYLVQLLLFSTDHLQQSQLQPYG